MVRGKLARYLEYAESNDKGEDKTDQDQGIQREENVE